MVKEENLMFYFVEFLGSRMKPGPGEIWQGAESSSVLLELELTHLEEQAPHSFFSELLPPNLFLELSVLISYWELTL